MNLKTLRKIREKLGLSRYAMAKELGRSRQSYEDLEDYAHKLDLHDLKKIRVLAKKVGIGDSELLDSLESDPKRTKARPSRPKSEK